MGSSLTDRIRNWGCRREKRREGREREGGKERGREICAVGKVLSILRDLGMQETDSAVVWARSSTSLGSTADTRVSSWDDSNLH